MNQVLYVGVDGGATKSHLRIEDAQGNVLGEEIGGPASIRISVEQAWNSINKTLALLLKKINLNKKLSLHVGMGLAGCELQSQYDAFMAFPHDFASLVVSSDAHTAFLGAHNGEDGAIIIAGTGAVGYQCEQNHITKIGGWGFPHDDEGGGAAIGLAAVKMTLKSLDGRLPESALTKMVGRHFGGNRDLLVNWANNANSTAFAELAPLVIQQGHSNDIHALHILASAATAIGEIFHALRQAQTTEKVLACALVGSIAPHLEPYLDKKIRLQLTSSANTPAAGAILLIKDFLRTQKRVPLYHV